MQKNMTIKQLQTMQDIMEGVFTIQGLSFSEVPFSEGHDLQEIVELKIKDWSNETYWVEVNKGGKILGITKYTADDWDFEKEFNKFKNLKGTTLHTHIRHL